MSDYFKQGYICVIIIYVTINKQTEPTYHSYPVCSPYGGRKSSSPKSHNYDNHLYKKMQYHFSKNL